MNSEGECAVCKSGFYPGDSVGGFKSTEENPVTRKGVIC